jgi:hypothetical protein
LPRTRLIAAVTLSALFVTCPIASGTSQAKVAIRVIALGGKVADASGQVDCSATCTSFLRPGSLVTLTATPGFYSDFTGWSEGCVGTVPQCVVSIDSPVTVKAIFTPHPGEVSVSVGGPGTVSATVKGKTALQCGSGSTHCEAVLDQGTTVTLDASPETGGVFSNWSGGCFTISGSTCTVIVGELIQVTAIFRHVAVPTVAQTLTVTKSSSFGTVLTTPSGIACPPTCTAQFAPGTVVTLSAGGSFGAADWSGDCAGGQSSCALVLDAPATVAAIIQPPTAPLAPRPVASLPGSWGVNVVVFGHGVVSGSGINCSGLVYTSSGCEGSVSGQLELTAVPKGRHAKFVGWANDCQQSGKSRVCTLPALTTMKVGATFSSR